MRRQPVDDYDGPFTKGVDVSRWQGPLDWDVIRKNNPDIDFVFIRTGDGSTADKEFSNNWENSSGLIRGSYHYLRADRGGEDQAKLALKLIDRRGGMLDHDLPPALDLEGGARNNLSGGIFTGDEDKLPIDLVAEEALAFLDTTEKELGVRPLVYTGQAFHWWFSQARPDLAKLFAKYPLWLPSYTDKPLMPVDKEGNAFPWKQWTFWQYTAKGSVMGIKGEVDVNYFRGTRSDLISFVKSLRTEETKEEPEDPYREIGELFVKLVKLANKT